MPFRKKVLYYGLLLLLTLLSIEGMAWIAYYAAYGAGYGGGGAAAIEEIIPPSIPAKAQPQPAQIGHPFYGRTRNSPYYALNAMPPRQRREDMVIVGLLGGSVARWSKPYFERALHRWFAANNMPRQPTILTMAFSGQHQPQQTLIVANTLLLGGEFDLIINLDGFNEVAGYAGWLPRDGVFPLFPDRWHQLAQATEADILLAGRLAVLRREQARLAAAGETSLLRRSAVFGLTNRWRQERIAAEIIRLNHELAAADSEYSLEKYGPRSWAAGETAALQEAARVWYRGSLALAQLAELAAAEYYHFLQPNQYAPPGKPLSREERESSYDPEGIYGYFAARGYPQLREFSRDLQNQGINYFDLTGIFADHSETLYIDECCHLNERGYELLAAAMVQRLEPALRRLGQDSPAAPVSAFSAARRPTEPDALLIDAAFQVYLQGEGRYLRYGRADCAAADVESRFFLHLTPRDLADLPRYRRGQGFDNRDFSFAEAGGRRWRGQCLAQIRLPDYPIAALRTGQYAADAGELWAGEFVFSE